MIKSIIVTQREEIEGQKGTYLKITDQEGKAHFIFDNLSDKWELLQPGKMVDLTKEKVGKYWNVIDIAEGSSKPKVEAQKTGYHREDPESKQRSYALSYAKDLCVAGKIELDKIIPCAESFNKWLIGSPESKDTIPSPKTPSLAALTSETLPKITPESVYKEIQQGLQSKKFTQAKVTELLKAKGALGDTGLEKVKSLSMENLLVLSAEVKRILNLFGKQ